MKKTISLLLSVTIALTAVFCAVPVSFAAEDAADIPVVHVCGSGTPIRRVNEAGEVETLFPMQIPEGYIEEKAEIFLPVFAEAFFTQEWDEFCDVLYECIYPIFSPMALNKNGEVDDGSYADWHWSKETLTNKAVNGKYSATAYKYEYDWRQDPLVIADGLHEYIEAILEVTGETEVALYGRCLGSNIVAAYMQKYDGEHVKEVIHYASAVYGATQCSKAFTGELFLHADGIERFVYDIDFGLEEYYMDLIQSFVTLFNKTYGLDITCWAVNNVMKDIYLDIFPRVMISSYGTFPSHWSMVSMNDYDRAMETVFYGSDLNEYAGLIEKIENYHENVQLKFAENTKAQAERGIEFSNIVKYGKQSIPVTENSDDLSDALVTVEESSFGATAVKVGETFSEEYIDNAVINSNAKYISPDKQIDASTCLSPYTTWFVKNLEHKEFPECMNGLVSNIVNNEGYNVFSDNEYPQYLVYDEETDSMSAMTAENYNTTVRWEVTFFDALKKFLSSVTKVVNNLMAEKKS